MVRSCLRGSKAAATACARLTWAAAAAEPAGISPLLCNLDSSCAARRMSCVVVSKPVPDILYAAVFGFSAKVSFSVMCD